MFELLILLLGFSFLTLAIIGLITVIQGLARLGSKTDSEENDSRADANDRGPSDTSSAPPSLKNDLAAARRLINHLVATEDLSDENYRRINNFLDRKFGAVAPSPSDATSNEPRSPSGLSLNEDQPPIAPSPHPPTSPAPQPSFEEPVVAEIVESEIVESTVDDSNLAPWDQPDPEPRPPRRSLGEILSGFMQEKNMRWGELTSGILIVLSAVGLVVSLREELSDTIPYFSSILFMLITGAIIGAGIYTLKQWKLRNTSRGTLVIGLLLVPLNFVAACVLSGGENRRELSDPWLWVAIVIGLAGFGAMTWWASKFLLRKHFWPLVVAVFGCGAGTLLLNRTVELSESSLVLLGLGMPLIICFVLGSQIWERRTWIKSYWSSRSRVRAYLCLGISAFAALTASSLLLIRSTEAMKTAIAMSPLLLAISLVVHAWGALLRWGGIGVGSRGARELGRWGDGEQGSGDAKQREEPTISRSPHLPTAPTHSLPTSNTVALSLQVLGAILVGIFLLASLANPTVFVVNALIAAGGILLIEYQRRSVDWLPAVWSIAAAGTLVALSLAIGNFQWDQWTSPVELRDAIVNGQSGLCLLLGGILAIVAQSAIAGRLSDAAQSRKTKRRGLLTGGAIFSAGCAIALIASLMNRQDVFDTMTASSLLLIGGVGFLVAGSSTFRRRYGLERSSDESTRTILANLGAGLLLAGLLHGLIWNPILAGWLNRATHEVGANWAWAFGLFSLTLAIVAALKQPAMDRIVLGNWSLVVGGLAIVAAIILIPQQSGNATGVMAAITLASWLWSRWGGRGIAEQNGQTELVDGGADDGTRERSARSLFGENGRLFGFVPFMVVSALLVATVIGELVSRTDWCPDWTAPRHWLIQVIGLSIWAIAWTVGLVQFVDRRPGQRAKLLAANWKEETATIHGVQWGLVAAIIGMLSAGLADGVMEQLFRRAGEFSFLGGADVVWGWAALGAVAIGMAISLVARPTAWKGSGLIALWMLAWAWGAEPFDGSISTASAMRWLVPFGGLMLAALISIRGRWIPVWAKLRNQLRLKGKSVWPKTSTQHLINLALMIVVVVVISISTVTVCQVMLHGEDSLGGPMRDSWFGKMDPVVSYGGPLVLLVSTFLVCAISERRPWLATAGSMVFQYMVLLSIVLLFLSPHPAMATEWFVRVLQSMSLGMTLYGLVWWWQRDRVGAVGSRGDGEQGRRWFRMSHLETHALINGLLVTSLAVLVYARFFFVPDQPGAWTNSVGSWLGIGASVLYAGFAIVVLDLRSRPSDVHLTSLSPHPPTPFQAIFKSLSESIVVVLLGWAGFISVAMVGAAVDFRLVQTQSVVPWLVFQVLTAGTVLVGVIELAWMAWIQLANGRRQHGGQVGIGTPTELFTFRSSFWPLVATLLLGLAFAVRGAVGHAAGFWFYESLVLTIMLTFFVYGLLVRQSLPVFMAAIVSIVASGLVAVEAPTQVLPVNSPGWLNLSVLVLAALAIIQVVFYAWRRWWCYEPIQRSFVCYANVALVVGAIWIFLGGLLEFVLQAGGFFSGTALMNGLGIGTLVAMVGLWLVSMLNDRRRFWVVSGCLIDLGIVNAVVCQIAGDDSDSLRASWMLLGSSMVVMAWGWCWRMCTQPMAGSSYQSARKSSVWLRKSSLPRTVALIRSAGTQLPIYSLLVGGVLVLIALTSIVFNDVRVERYMAAAVPLVLAIGVGCLSNPVGRRGLQLVTLGLVTLGALMVGWADLIPREMVAREGLSILVRSLLVLAGAMFVYGGLVTRWLREGDHWIRSLRESAGVTCGLAIGCLVLLICAEAARFEESVGSGLTVGEAVAVAVVVVGMVIGLISIAVRPERDPFALSLKGRQAYVFVAQVVVAALVAHLYFSMPWLFRWGIKEYWPYIAMVICFGGVGLAQVLEKRNLTVLGQPLFQTAAALPVLVAVAIFAIDSKADGSLVMLTAGLAYLMIGYLHRSIVAGAAAVVFGNLALWIFYGKFPHFSFFEHPQLWLIPPAVSVLIAGQLNRESMEKRSLAMLRYICVAVIYVSSTSEIFISGLGDSLWPPMVLATLSVGGIFAGMLLRVKSFLYLGSLFLLMAMITMVAHAHQRLDHVWPWWAFGITLGVAILVMFGLFEKRRNEMKEIAGRLKEWDE